MLIIVFIVEYYLLFIGTLTIHTSIYLVDHIRLMTDRCMTFQNLFRISRERTTFQNINKTQITRFTQWLAEQHENEWLLIAKKRLNQRQFIRKLEVS